MVLLVKLLVLNLKESNHDYASIKKGIGINSNAFFYFLPFLLLHRNT
ncbi:hypothetical protein BN1088_1433428 [Sphingobacterium sp. PM2-P1-29]|nr:hypothetical protein BN1088_1433428 [Sphingobacterium sp. PM2-P1-29]